MVVSSVPLLRVVLRSSENFDERLIAFACVEGIHFSGPFCAIFWLKASWTVVLYKSTVVEVQLLLLLPMLII